MGRFEAFLGVNPWTALFTLLNFIALFLVLKKFLWGPVMKMIAERQQEIDDLYADADEAKEDAEKMRAAYEEKLAEAQKTGDQIIKEATARGQRREEEILGRQASRQMRFVEKRRMTLRAIRKKLWTRQKVKLPVWHWILPVK